MILETKWPPKEFDKFLEWSKKVAKEKWIDIEKEVENKTKIENATIKENITWDVIKRDEHTGDVLYHKNFNFFVRLKKNKEKREVWYYSHKDNTFYTTRKYSKHYFRKIGAWGFNYHLLEFLIKTFWKINIEVYDKEKNKTYRFKNFGKQEFDFYKEGNTLKFSNQGFELQIFIQLKDFDLLDNIKKGNGKKN